MTSAEISIAIANALGSVAFEPPVSVAYCAAVRSALRGVLPEGAKVDVFHRHETELEVQVRVGTRVVLEVVPLV